MDEKKSRNYEKPVSLDAGTVASVLGLNCSEGSGADELCRSGSSAALGCVTGNNPDVEFICQNTGATADGNCEQSGNTAGKTCYQTGATPGWGCISPS